MVFFDFLAFGAAVGFGMYIGVRVAQNQIPFKEVAELVNELRRTKGNKRRR